MKSKQEEYQELVEISRNDDCATGNLLDYLCHQNYYKGIATDLSRKTNMTVPQQINFIGKLKEDYGVTIFFIAKNSKKPLQAFL